MRSGASQWVFLSWGLLAFVTTLTTAVAQYVEVTADVEVIDWSRGASRHPWTVRCLVGTNSWQIDDDFMVDGHNTYWFTGTNIIEHSVVTKDLSREHLGAAIGTEVNRVTESVDGNPGTLSACGPGRHEGPDRLGLVSRIAWLAFCSGPCVKRDGRHIFPPEDLWKELICAPTGFSDRTVVFDDALGLPRTVNLYTTNGQPVLQYRVSSSTNVLDWEFPQEFYLAEYLPAYMPGSNLFSTNAWELHLLAVGRVTAIGPGVEPRIPPEVLKTVHQ